jgi:hypothetical protein
MAIRPATKADIDQLVTLSDLKRTQYEQYAPTFWRKARDANVRQACFFADLLDRDSVIALIDETRDQVNGFVIASIREAPPVYDPGTAICSIDDFVVSTPDDWPRIGAALLAKVRQAAGDRGAHLTVVVCGRQDERKREMLRQAGFEVASEWYVTPL